MRELNLAFNYFTGVNLKPETAECAFPLLEGLDLGFNYIESERDVVAIVILERLQRIVLYGNPLAGPTGEDPLGLCVENLIEESDRCTMPKQVHVVQCEEVAPGLMLSLPRDAVGKEERSGVEAIEAPLCWRR